MAIETPEKGKTPWAKIGGVTGFVAILSLGIGIYQAFGPNEAPDPTPPAPTSAIVNSTSPTRGATSEPLALTKVGDCVRKQAASPDDLEPSACGPKTFTILGRYLADPKLEEAREIEEAATTKCKSVEGYTDTSWYGGSGSTEPPLTILCLARRA